MTLFMRRPGLQYSLVLIAVLMGASLNVSDARAVQPEEILQDAGLEQRARSISAELRCLVCQNQSIDDSNAQLARDLRMIVRERLQKGDTDNQVRAYVVARYGEFVLLKPTFGWHNLLLWLTPLAGLLGGGLLALRYMRRSATASGSGVRELTDAEQKQLDQLLKDTSS